MNYKIRVQHLPEIEMAAKLSIQHQDTPIFPKSSAVQLNPHVSANRQ
jgi:hypothetical protein